MKHLPSPAAVTAIFRGRFSELFPLGERAWRQTPPALQPHMDPTVMNRNGNIQDQGIVGKTWWTERMRPLRS